VTCVPGTVWAAAFVGAVAVTIAAGLHAADTLFTGDSYARRLMQTATRCLAFGGATCSLIFVIVTLAGAS